MQPYLLAQKKREKDPKEERLHLACTGSFTQKECFLLLSVLLVAEICTFSLLLLEPFPKSRHLRKNSNSFLDSHYQYNRNGTHMLRVFVSGICSIFISLFVLHSCCYGYVYCCITKLRWLCNISLGNSARN